MELRDDPAPGGSDGEENKHKVMPVYIYTYITYMLLLFNI